MCAIKIAGFFLKKNSHRSRRCYSGDIKAENHSSPGSSTYLSEKKKRHGKKGKISPKLIPYLDVKQSEGVVLLACQFSFS